MHHADDVGRQRDRPDDPRPASPSSTRSDDLDPVSGDLARPTDVHGASCAAGIGDAVRADSRSGTVGAVNGRRVPPGGGVAVLDPAGLYRLEPDAPALDDPVLVVVLDGFVDAGAAARLAVESLLAAGAAQRVVRFDVDQLVDYRSRRPPLRFETDHWEHYAAPELDVVALTDTGSTGYLLLTGPEPDTQWERFAAALEELVRTLGRAPRGEPDGDPDGGAAHPAHRGDGARHAARADRGTRGTVRHGRGARAVPWRSSSTGSGRPGTRRWGSPCTCPTTWRARSTRRPRACWSTTSRSRPGSTCRPTR